MAYGIKRQSKDRHKLNWERQDYEYSKKRNQGSQIDGLQTDRMERGNCRKMAL